MDSDNRPPGRDDSSEQTVPGDGLLPDQNAAADEDSKRKIFAEPVKQQQVSHWDQDYLTREQLDAMMRSEGPEEGAAESDTPQGP